MFINVGYLHASLIFADKVRSLPLECSIVRGFTLVGSSLAGIEGKRLTLTNTTAYYDEELITALKTLLYRSQVKLLIVVINSSL